MDSELQQGAASSERSERTVRLQQKSKELKERLMVSEATVQAQAEQLKDYRELLSDKFDTLIQAQARELSHLRQRLREGRGVCNILTQHLGDTTKAFEELLRANDIDYYMGQSFRDQLAQSSALAQRVSAKISGRESADFIYFMTRCYIQPVYGVNSLIYFKWTTFGQKKNQFTVLKCKKYSYGQITFHSYLSLKDNLIKMTKSHIFSLNPQSFSFIC
uniref:Uncharacterized protein n=1 Tax=Seriola dumerili TaxID=41447 RepID=A0A3B4VGT4_SERDU